MDFVIRNIKEDGLDTAAKVFVASFNAVGEMWDYGTALARLESLYNPDFCLGAFVDKKLVGILSTKIDYVTDHKELYIDIIAVLPDYQGQNVGKTLLKKAEDVARENGLKTVWLLASTKLPSFKFYTATGFKNSHWLAMNKNIYV